MLAKQIEGGNPDSSGLNRELCQRAGGRPAPDEHGDAECKVRIGSMKGFASWEAPAWRKPAVASPQLK